GFTDLVTVSAPASIGNTGSSAGDNSTLLIFRAVDNAGNGVNGVTVNFVASRGTLSTPNTVTATSATGTTGIATVTVTESGNVGQTVTVTAHATGPSMVPIVEQVAMPIVGD